jgi:hypothetical protein
MTDIRRGWVYDSRFRFGRDVVMAVLVVSWPTAALAQTLTLPDKPVKLDARGSDLVVTARTVAVVATGSPTMEITSVDPNTGRATLVIHDGIRRRVDGDKAKQEVQEVIRDWGRFTLTDDLERADLILAIAESTVPASTLSQMAGDTTHRLRDTLGVFARGVPEPIWVNTATENTLGALTGSAAGKVAEKFRRAMEEADRKKD